MNFFRFLRVLTLVIWLGGIVFFSLVVAPAVFRTLAPVSGGGHLAGDIVNLSLTRLHWTGIVCGVVFLIASATLHKTFLRSEIYFVVLMLILTATSQFSIVPKMERLRADSPGIEDSAPGARSGFDSLHRLSVYAEGGVLLLGLAVVWRVAGNRSNRPYRS
jgi:uncharacterized membrane protein